MLPGGTAAEPAGVFVPFGLVVLGACGAVLIAELLLRAQCFGAGVGTLHGRDQLVLGERGALDREAAADPYLDAVAELEFLGLVADQQYRETFVAVVLDDLQDRRLRGDVHACRRVHQDQDGGLRAERRAQQYLLLVAAAQLAHRLADGRARDAELGALLFGEAAAGLAVDQQPAGQATQRGEADVVLDGHAADQTGLDAILRYQGHPGAHGGVRVPAIGPDLSILELDPAGPVMVMARQTQRDPTGAGSGVAGEADHLAGPQPQRERIGVPGTVQPFGLEHDGGVLGSLSTPVAGLLRQLLSGAVVTDHGRDHVGRAEVRSPSVQDICTVAQHRHRIADLWDLVEVMGDEQERDAPLAQLVDPVHQRLDLAGHELRRRFVEDDEPRALSQCPDDLDHLGLADTEFGHLLGGEMGISQRSSWSWPWC